MCLIGGCIGLAQKYEVLMKRQQHVYYFILIFNIFNEIQTTSNNLRNALATGLVLAVTVDVFSMLMDEHKLGTGIIQVIYSYILFIQ